MHPSNMRGEGEVVRLPSERVEARARFDEFFEEEHLRAGERRLLWPDASGGGCRILRDAAASPVAPVAGGTGTANATARCEPTTECPRTMLPGKEGH